ncbi:transcriptional regulator PpsR [Parasulfitobacter algicola]|uniref:Transcriptional regulator PpsR n=1 Tax=Parasulfitobacter algicola TaxID=2614809 RepID=A0ABX2IM72_9RHOB|nr:transcriptional regulator PpsR [Sulfitobacter algicola]NSX53465.1 transcriptional regulator PpsR [Sulfitobacter algicola]
MTSRGLKYWSNGSIPLISPEILQDVIAAASDISVVISTQGNVLSVLINPNHQSLGRLDHWENHNIRDYLRSESIPKFDQRLEEITSGLSKTDQIELNHLDNGVEFPVRYTMHSIGTDGAILMLGRDLRPIAEIQQQLVKAQIALERDYEAQREFDTRYRVLMETTEDAFVFVSATTGKVIDLNRKAAKILGGNREDITGSAFSQAFGSVQNAADFLTTLSETANTDAPKPIQAKTRNSNKQVMIAPKIFRVSGESVLLCMVSVGEKSTASNETANNDFAAFYNQAVEGIIFTDKDGTITSANDAFLDMAETTALSKIKGKSLADFLSRGVIDLKVLLENAGRAGQMRLYSTKLKGEFESQTSVEISVSYLKHASVPAFVFVLRDVRRTEALREPTMPNSDTAVKSVMELVGSATLKDIISETTDVIEKMCIETAVELTRNNRVAAAEMLGLSRQSLYVKLRKYGLLAKD